MKKMMKFCVKHNLVSKDDADRIMYESERETLHPIRTVERFSIDVGKMYEEASLEYSLALSDAKELTLSDKRLDSSIEKQFDIVTIVNDEHIEVITWNFFEVDIIPRAIENITGKKVKLTLVPYEAFDKLQG